MGASWGGLSALERVLAALPRDFPTPIAVAQHRSPDRGSEQLARLLGAHSSLPVVDVDDKTPVEQGRVYLAPPDYHLYLDADGFALSVDEAVLYSRPSIDVLFESAADIYRDRLIAVVLTGANEDGAHGLARIKERGGVAIVQDPATSARRTMPDAAIAATSADAILPLEEIPKFLNGLCG